jgi:ABC-type phosphate/phosphonate transport system substrate-binding protein
VIPNKITASKFGLFVEAVIRKKKMWGRRLGVSLMIFWGAVWAEPLVFGVIAAVKPDIVREHFQPLLNHLERELGMEIRFATGRDYDDTIDKFVDGTFDLGYIGPSPYVLATRKAPGSIRVIAGIESDHKPTFRAAIVVHKSMDPALAEKIRRLLFSVKDPAILHSIKKQMSGFGPRKDSDYDELRKIMEIVDRHAGYIY